MDSIKDKSILTDVWAAQSALFQKNLLKASIPCNFLAFTIVYILLYGNFSYRPLLTWFLACLLIQVVRLGVCFWAQFRNAIYDRLHLLLGCLSAVCWSLTSLIFMPMITVVDQMVLVAVIAGIVAGSAQTFRTNRFTSLFIIGVILLPISLDFVFIGGTYSLEGCALLVYLGFLIFFTQNSYKLFLEELNLQCKNLELMNQLHESEKKFRLSFDSAAIGMALVSLDGHWQKVNESLCKIVGYTSEELCKIDFQTITHPDDLAKDLDYVQQLIDGKIDNYRMEKRYIHKKGNIIWILLSVATIRNEAGQAKYFIGQIQDITAQKKAEEQLKSLAYHDALTGLKNRVLLESLYEQAIYNAHRHNHDLAVMYLDIDYFKSINDNLGHEVGDELLKITASRLQNALCASDIAARLGGDEFVLIITKLLDKKDVQFLVNKIRNILAEKIYIKTNEISITASIGISLYPKHGLDLKTLIEHADKALYHVKVEGGNGHKFYSEE